MASFLEFGTLVHWAAMALEVHLITQVWPSRHRRPLFVAYNVLLFFSTATLFVGYEVLSHSAYFALYWGVTSVEAALALGVVGELYGDAGPGLVVGLLGAIEMNLCGQPVIAARIYGAMIAGGAFLYLVGSRKNGKFRTSPVENKLIAAGIVVFFTFPSILYQFHIPEWTTYVPVYAGMITRVIWLKVTIPTECRATK